MNLLKTLVGKLVCLFLGASMAVLGLYLFKTLSGPPLDPWHLWKSPAEFHSQADTISDFPAYLRLETDLLNDLSAFRHTLKTSRISRYSPSNPLAHPVDGFDWNRTVELQAGTGAGTVLLLHGMSDSPYSLRSLSTAFHHMGMRVLALRLPGHGTVPASLTRFTWRDMAEAVRLATRYLQSPPRQHEPFYIVGYSNGAALALDYTLKSLQNTHLPRPSAIVLLSPALAVTPAARFSKLIIGASYLPGLQKLAWLSRQPEYDPYKYNSFAVNAGYQVYLLAERVQEGLRSFHRSGKMETFPPVLAIQSVVDTTVSSKAVVNLLMTYFHSGKDELILFDVNRDAEIVTLFAKSDHHLLESLMNETADYDLTLVTNCHPDSPRICARHRPSGHERVVSSPLAYQWPKGIYSLSHVALPIPPNDPVYGTGTDDEPTLGRVELRGEQKLLQVPAAQLMRLRYNPFYGYMERRIVEFTLKNANVAETPLQIEEHEN